MSDLYDGNRRRANDSLSPEEVAEQDASFRMCPAFNSHVTAIMIHEDLQKILTAQIEQSQTQKEQAEEIKKMAEMMTAWNNAKGFIKTMRTIGEVTKWIVAVGGAIAIMWYFLIGKK